MNDLRYAAQTLAKSPLFTLTAAGLLAAGIGATTVIFSAFDALMLRPLPVRNPQELVRMVQRSPQLGARSDFSYAYYESLRDHASSLSAVFGEEEFRAAMNEPAPAEEVRISLVTPEYFDALGVPAMIGRTLARSDANENPGAPPAVLSYTLWRRKFDADPQAIGRLISLKGHRFEVVGVMPREFNGISTDTSPDVRVPARTLPIFLDTSKPPAGPALSELYLSLAGRLRPGVTLARARPECFSLWRESVEHSPNFAWGASAQAELRRGMDVEPVARGVSILRDKFSTALELLVALVSLLLLMVCANVAGLLLARGESRKEEIVVRMAMGATRGRIVRKVLTESALLAMIGAAGGLLIAWIATPLLARAFPPVRDFTTERLALSVQFGIDWRLLIFSTVVSGMCVLLAGAAPAIHAARMNGDTVLRGARSSSGWGSRQGLLVFQIALCTALLAGAGLLTRTLAQLQAVDPGFDRDHIVTFTANPGLASYRPAQAEALRVALLDRVRNLTGIRSVALADRPLMRGSGIKMTIAPMGDRITDQDFLNTSTNTVSPEYFLTMGMRIVDGRNFTAEDARRKEAPQPVVVNEAFVRRFFPRTEAVGKRFGGGRVGPAKGDYEILGVASDAKYRSLREPMTPTMYRPWIGGAETFQLVVRTDGRPESVIDPVRRTLASLDPALPFTEIETMQDEISASTAPERSTAILASMIAIAAAVLAGIGIYGLLAYMVAERRREIGIRMALGARAAHVGKMFAIQSGWMGLLGAAIGLGTALLALPWIRSLLYGIAPADPVSLGSAAVFVIAVTAVATAIPVFRATRIDPATALRQEN